MRRYEDWLKQGKIDIKSLLRFINIDSWRYGLVHFLKDWMNEIKSKKKRLFNKKEYDDLLKKCQTLDSYYIQARYPNGFSSGFPAEYYNKTKAQRSISYAKDIISYVEEKIKALSASEGT